MRNPLHIALGDSAAGCLRAACRSHGMPGTVRSIPDDLSHGPYDPWLMDACAPIWMPAPRVIGTAMGRCGERNAMSNLFLASRLQVLIDSGRIEADGPRHRLREYAVRLAEA